MSWLRDFGLGVRFAVGGGREGWTRTALTAVGVGLGVALLLVASSVPHLLDQRSLRDQAREEASASRDADIPESDSTVLRIDAATEYRGLTVEGFLMRAEGSHPVVPPGVTDFPGPGEMAASPALAELLDSPDGALLKERLPYEITTTIADAGLRSPGELYFYAGSDSLTPATGGHRLAGYGGGPSGAPLSPVLVVLVILICVVLLAPVAVFIATAVRFGGERRDRRLAALRLVGTDIRATRRIAAGEALFGSLLGLLAGFAFFLVGRRFVGHVEVWNHSAFPSDLTPTAWLVALVALAVPLSAVLVTLAAMRSVAVEPLGVVRSARGGRRRLWWRLLIPVAGLAVLGLTGRVDEFTPVNPYPIAAGAVLVLFGLALLLPWLVEAVVNRLRGGPLPWQLAVRRLQLNSGAASRAAGGITVAVAGAVALQMLFAAVGDEFERMTGQDPSRAQFHTYSERVDGDAAARTIEAFRSTEGVEAVIGTVETYVTKPGKYSEDEVTPTTTLSIGDCATLKELAEIGACEEGDVFVVHPRGDRKMSAWVDETARKGEEIELNSSAGYTPDAESVRWTLPADARTVTAAPDPLGDEHWGIMATVGAVDPRTLPNAQTMAQIRVDEDVEDAAEYVRNTAAGIDPGMRVATLHSVERDRQYASVQTGLRFGAAATLLLIAASMLVSQLEQLRERKRLLSVLVAFGTRRVTLGWSVLWQTAVPVAVGLLVAITGGLGLGAVMTWMLAKTVTRWWLFLPMAGAGAALVAAVTLLSLPLLWRLMRPDGLRTE
ncbi:ABC transporter permease [Streptomyces mutomycini]|uniref:ABC transporter permease n=2 Tax=Streptomyces TaxID=1883 RepID=A0ABW0AWY9_9ACTN|nr:FtsX-like permease family protein [Streptomyces mutomycini]